MLKLRVSMKPFMKSVKKKMESMIMSKRMMYDIGRAGVKNIKNAHMVTSKKGERIRTGVNFTIGVRSVTFHMGRGEGASTGRKDKQGRDNDKKSGFYYQNYGVKRHQMKYLMKSKRPIPLIAKFPNHKKGENVGDLIFRWASKASMDRGGWWHPGTDPKNFFEGGIDDMRDEIKKRIKGLIRSSFNRKR